MSGLIARIRDRFWFATTSPRPYLRVAVTTLAKVLRANSWNSSMTATTGGRSCLGSGFAGQRGLVEQADQQRSEQLDGPFGDEPAGQVDEQQLLAVHDVLEAQAGAGVAEDGPEQRVAVEVGGLVQDGADGAGPVVGAEGGELRPAGGDARVAGGADDVGAVGGVGEELRERREAPFAAADQRGEGGFEEVHQVRGGSAVQPPQVGEHGGDGGGPDRPGDRLPLGGVGADPQRVDRRQGRRVG